GRHRGRAAAPQGVAVRRPGTRRERWHGLGRRDGRLERPQRARMGQRGGARLLPRAGQRGDSPPRRPGQDGPSHRPAARHHRAPGPRRDGTHVSAARTTRPRLPPRDTTRGGARVLRTLTTTTPGATANLPRCRPGSSPAIPFWYDYVI